MNDTKTAAGVMAAFEVSTALVSLLVKKGVLTKQDAVNVFGCARMSLKITGDNPTDVTATAVADRLLSDLERVYSQLPETLIPPSS